MKSAMLALFLMLGVVHGQTDGNPHNWDRRRRCDHIDYSPPCGICEGYGGLATGNENDEIELTTCVPISTEIPSPKRPIWGTTFTAKHYSEILIGPKLDPFCFQVFPSNSSAGDLCYRPDEGLQVYDMAGPTTTHSLYEQLNVYTPIGNVTSTLVHSGQNFWVINKFPWYAAGVHQCICTFVREGGIAGGRHMYPIQYNWTNHLNFVGRENITVEYGIGEKTLDHWAYGPHHVWTIPSTGYIRRMWQPFNGLQVFGSEGGNSNTTIDHSLFADIPPALCKSGSQGALFKIKCDDEGYPTDPAEAATTALAGNVLHGVEQEALQPGKDTARARTVEPRDAYKGDDFAQMSATLNKWLLASDVQTKPCGEWSATDLQQLQGFLYLARHSDLDDIYQAADDNRKLQKPIEDIRVDWAALNELVAAEQKEVASPKAHAIQRDGHCHEAVMWWVHHLTEDMKQALAESDVIVPLLSLQPHKEECTADATADEHDAVAAACGAYVQAVTCVDCHSNSIPPNHGFLVQ